MAFIQGIHKKNKIQTKILSANPGATGVMSDLTFNNLVVGKIYKISGKIFHVENGLNLDDVESIVFIKNGSTVIDRSDQNIRKPGSTNLDEFRDTNHLNIKFKATDPTLTFEVNSLTNADIAGDGTKQQTYVQLEEVTDTEETTDFS